MGAKPDAEMEKQSYIVAAMREEQSQYDERSLRKYISQERQKSMKQMDGRLDKSEKQMDERLQKSEKQMEAIAKLLQEVTQRLDKIGGSLGAPDTHQSNSGTAVFRSM